MTPDAMRLLDDLEREYAGDPWHGSSLKEILADIGAEQAARRVSGEAHSIWELVLHMTGWKREVAARLQGKAASEPAAGDWPAVQDETPAAWRAALEDQDRAQRELVAAIRALPADRLHAPVKDFRDDALGTGLTAYQTISGLIQHDVYHAGQIGLLRKLAAGMNRPV